MTRGHRVVRLWGHLVSVVLLAACADDGPTHPWHAAAKLAFTTQPRAVVAGVAMSPAVQVTVQDAQGNAVTNSTVSIVLTMTGGTGTGGAVVGGTLTQSAVAGVATFDNLTVDHAGTGLSLTATATGLAGASSQAFAASSDTVLADGTRGLTGSERTVVGTGAAWGVLVSLKDGTIGLVYQKARPLAQVGGVNVSIEFVRSTDSGRTWGKAPVRVHERRGLGGGLFDRTADSGYVVYQSRNLALWAAPGLVDSELRYGHQLLEDDGALVAQR